MFCALNGATSIPSWANMRHKAAAITLLPTDDPVPWTMIAFALRPPILVLRLQVGGLV